MRVVNDLSSDSRLCYDGSWESKKQVIDIMWERWWKKRCPYLESTPPTPERQASKYYLLRDIVSVSCGLARDSGFNFEPLEELFEMAFWKDYVYLKGLARSSRSRDNDLFRRIMSGREAGCSPNNRLRKELEEKLFSGPDKFFKQICDGDVSGIRAILDKRPTFAWLPDNINNIFDLSIIADVEGPRPDISASGRTPLYAAVQFGYSAIVKLLLEHPDINPNQSSLSLQRTPLHRACRENKKNLVELLLRHVDIDKNIQDKDGKTPLYLAVENKRHEAVAMLIAESDVDPNILCNSALACSPIHIACASGDEVLVDLLLKSPNLDTNVKDKDGKTPLFVATEKGHKNIVGKLLAFGADRRIEARVGDESLRPLDIANADVSKAEIGEMLKVKLTPSEQKKLVREIFTVGHYKLLTVYFVNVVKSSFQLDFNPQQCAEKLEKDIVGIEQEFRKILSMEYKIPSCDGCLNLAKAYIADLLHQFIVRLNVQDEKKGTSMAVKFKETCEHMPREVKPRLAFFC